MLHSPTDLGEHYIICGYGRVGHTIVAGLRRRRQSVIVIDPDTTALSAADDVRAIEGDATDDTTLVAAGITRAHGLVAGTGNDATNLAIALSARALNARLLIVARANQPEAEAKLRRAGATRVVSPYAIGAHRMAAQLASPGMLAFLDTIRDGEQVDLWIEEATVGVGSSIAGRLVADAVPRSPGSPNLIALRRSVDGRMLAKPPPDMRLAPGDTLIVVGSRAHLRELIARAAVPATTPVPSV